MILYYLLNRQLNPKNAAIMEDEINNIVNLTTPKRQLRTVTVEKLDTERRKRQRIERNRRNLLPPLPDDQVAPEQDNQVGIIANRGRRVLHLQ